MKYLEVLTFRLLVCVFCCGVLAVPFAFNSAYVVGKTQQWVRAQEEVLQACYQAEVQQDCRTQEYKLDELERTLKYKIESGNLLLLVIFGMTVLLPFIFYWARWILTGRWRPWWPLHQQD